MNINPFEAPHRMQYIAMKRGWEWRNEEMTQAKIMERIPKNKRVSTPIFRLSFTPTERPINKLEIK